MIHIKISGKFLMVKYDLSYFLRKLFKLLFNLVVILDNPNKIWYAKI